MSNIQTATMNKVSNALNANEKSDPVREALFASAIVQKLDALSQKRATWEVTEYRKANEGLYALLGDCYDLYQEKYVSASEDERSALRKELSKRLKAVGVKVQPRLSISPKAAIVSKSGQVGLHPDF